jgi:hypothetical protein
MPIRPVKLLNGIPNLCGGDWYGQKIWVISLCSVHGGIRNRVVIELFQKISTLPPRRKFLPSRGERRNIYFCKCIFRTSEGGTGTNVEFPLWGGMDLFWNNPGVKKWGQEMYSCTKHERFLKYGSN